MAMLKTLVRKNGGCADIKNYLEKDGRSLAFDSDGLSTLENWDAEFDRARRYHDPEDAGRKYYHFIISPDPEDGCSLEALREIATTWVRERYPEGQWVIEYHNDNGIPHAHVVLNSVMYNGRKVHIDNEGVRRDALALQELCRERGLRSFESGKISRDEDGWTVVAGPSESEKNPGPRVSRTSAESALGKKGGWVWKDDVRNAIDKSLVGARTWDAFERNMKQMGYGCKRGRRGVTFTHPKARANGTARKVRGTVTNLGADYTVPGILARLQPNLEHSYDGAAGVPRRELVLPTRSYPQLLERRARRRPWLDPQRVADAITVVRLNGFTSHDEITERLDALKVEAQEVALEVEDVRALADMAVNAVEKATTLQMLLSLQEDGEPLDLEDAHAIEEIESWLTERGIDPASGVEGTQAMAIRLRGEAARAQRKLEAINEDAVGLKQVLSTLDTMGDPQRQSPEQAAERIARAGVQSAESARVVDLDSLKMKGFESTLDRFERFGDDNLKAWAFMQREALLYEQMERGWGEQVVGENREPRAAEGPVHGHGAPAGKKETIEAGDAEFIAGTRPTL